MKEAHASTSGDFSTLPTSNIKIPRKRKPAVGRLKQTFILLSRSWKGLLRDSNTVLVQVIGAVVISLLVGIVYFQLSDDLESARNRLNAILFLMCVLSLVSLPAIAKLIEEKLIYTREHASGYYSTFPYCASCFLSELPVLILTVMSYTVIPYWMIGFQSGSGSFVFFTVTVFVIIQVSYGACQVISSNVKTLNKAIAIDGMFVLYSLLLGGFFIHVDQLPSLLGWLIYTSYFYYGFAALVANEFEGKSYGPQFIEGLGLGEVNKYYNLAILIFLWVALKLFEYLSLRYFSKEKR